MNSPRAVIYVDLCRLLPQIPGRGVGRLFLAYSQRLGVRAAASIRSLMRRALPVNLIVLA